VTVLVDGTKAELPIEVTVTPDSVTYGVLEAGAGVYTVVVAPDGVVKVSATGLGRLRVAVEPLGVTTGMEVTEAGTVTVVVPPDGVRTCETTVDGATATEMEPPLEVSTVAELTETSDDGVETNDEAITGIEAYSPLAVLTCWVAYGELKAGV
jgi:hypothetical protein